MFQAGQNNLERALVHLSSRLDALASDVLRGWKTAAHARGLKQGKARKAVAHWMGNRLAIGFYAWHVRGSMPHTLFAPRFDHPQSSSCRHASRFPWSRRPKCVPLYCSGQGVIWDVHSQGGGNTPPARSRAIAR